MAASQTHPGQGSGWWWWGGMQHFRCSQHAITTLHPSSADALGNASAVAFVSSSTHLCLNKEKLFCLGQYCSLNTRGGRAKALCTTLPGAHAPHCARYARKQTGISCGRSCFRHVWYMNAAATTLKRIGHAIGMGPRIVFDCCQPHNDDCRGPHRNTFCHGDS